MRVRAWNKEKAMRHDYTPICLAIATSGSTSGHERYSLIYKGRVFGGSPLSYTILPTSTSLDDYLLDGSLRCFSGAATRD